MPPSDSQFLTLTSMLRLRWLALAVLPIVLGLGLFNIGPNWPANITLTVFAAGILGQIALTIATRRGLGEGAAMGVLALDGVLLTALFAFTDGSATPYALLYVFPVVLAGLTVRAPGSWLVFATTTIGYASLFWLAPADLHAHDHNAMATHMWGMFAAYIATSALLAFAVGRIRHTQSMAEARIREANALESRNQRLSSLATLAAGAAHELATPLSTIAIVACELEHRSDDPRNTTDIQLIREEVTRCRTVLNALSADAGAGTGAAPQHIPVSALLQSAIGDGADITITAPETPICVPAELLRQVLRRLVENARDAGATHIEVTATTRGHPVAITVRDDGEGMTEDQMRQAGEPFFTTKDTGMGMGLFFSRRVIEQLGGTFHIASSATGGITAVLILPDVA